MHLLCCLFQLCAGMCALCEARFAARVCILQRSEEHVRASGSGVTGVCESAGPWMLGTGLLEEQEGILTAEPVLLHQAAPIYVRQNSTTKRIETPIYLIPKAF